MPHREAHSAIITLPASTLRRRVYYVNVHYRNSGAKVSRTKVCSRIAELLFAPFITRDSLPCVFSLSFFYIDLLAVARTAITSHVCRSFILRQIN